MIHTFSYENKQYRVKDLHEFVKDKSYQILDMNLFSSLLEKDINTIWSSIKDNGETLPVTFNDIINHINRINSSDIDFPIIILKDKSYQILDGWHRFIKSCILKLDKIKVILLNIQDIKKFISNY